MQLGLYTLTGRLYGYVVFVTPSLDGSVVRWYRPAAFSARRQYAQPKTEQCGG